MFDLHSTERLEVWRNFRETIETSDTPLEDVVELWKWAPMTSKYISENSELWPDPWHLIIDNKWDDLGVALGMLYSVKLTQRFKDTYCEIHTTVLPKDGSLKYILIVDNTHVLNLEYGSIVPVNTEVKQHNINLLWSGNNLP